MLEVDELQTAAGICKQIASMNGHAINNKRRIRVESAKTMPRRQRGFVRSTVAYEGADK